MCMDAGNLTFPLFKLAPVDRAPLPHRIDHCTNVQMLGHALPAVGAGREHGRAAGE